MSGTYCLKKIFSIVGSFEALILKSLVYLSSIIISYSTCNEF